MTARYILELYGALAQNSLSNQLLNITPIGAGSNGIPNLIKVDLSTNAITINCGATPGNNIIYDYSFADFNAEFLNNCQTSGKSYMIFTPKSGATGTKKLGDSMNSDGGFNEAFIITHIDKQNGDFYLTPSCDVDGATPTSHNILVTALDNTILP